MYPNLIAVASLALLSPTMTSYALSGLGILAGYIVHRIQNKVTGTTTVPVLPPTTPVVPTSIDLTHTAEDFGALTGTLQALATGDKNLLLTEVTYAARRARELGGPAGLVEDLVWSWMGKNLQNNQAVVLTKIAGILQVDPAKLLDALKAASVPVVKILLLGFLLLGLSSTALAANMRPQRHQRIAATHVNDAPTFRVPLNQRELLNAGYMQQSGGYPVGIAVSAIAPMAPNGQVAASPIHHVAAAPVRFLRRFSPFRFFRRRC